MERFVKGQNSNFPILDTPDDAFRRFEHAEKKKFWEVHLGWSPGGRPRRHTREGAIGAEPKEVVAYLGSDSQAERNVEKMIEAKLASGYVEKKQRVSKKKAR